MQLNPDNLEQSAIYKLLTGAVIPRPIGWISSISQDGINNLAPFSFFNAVGDDPPHVMFSAARGNNTNKDTLNNVLATKQFAVNMVTEDLVEKMNATAQALHPDEDEFIHAGVTAISCEKIKPMRVKECMISFECELVHHYSLENHKFGGATIIVGKVIMMHIADEILMEGYKIDISKYQPVSRLAGAYYARLGETFVVKRN